VFEEPEELKEWLQENSDLCGKSAQPIDETLAASRDHNVKTDFTQTFSHSGKTVHGEKLDHDGKTVNGSTVNGKPVDIVITERVNTDLDLDLDPNSYKHSDPDRACKKEKRTRGKSVSSRASTKILPVESSSICDDKFSAAPPNSSIDGFPIGPWGTSLFAMDAGFIQWMISQWRKGNNARSQTFGTMADEEVRGCLLKYWRKDWQTLSIDWDGYRANTLRVASSVAERQAQGVENSVAEQRDLLIRIHGPAHLQPQHTLSPSRIGVEGSMMAVPMQSYASAALTCLPVALAGDRPPEEIEETRRAIEAAKRHVRLPENSKLWSFGKPSEQFMEFLLDEARTNRLPAMSLRATALVLAKRPDAQAKFLARIAHE
jgi:hypothetical protein